LLEIEELKGVSFVSDCQNKPDGDISILRSNVDNIRSSASQSSIRDQVEKTSSDYNTMSTPTSLSKVHVSTQIIICACVCTRACVYVRACVCVCTRAWVDVCVY